MAKKEKTEIPMWAQLGHKKPVSRRDFLACGLIPFSASLIAPSWLNLLLPSQAHADPVCAAAASGMIPFVTLNLSGGAGLQANYVPMDQGLQLLPSYQVMGLGDNQLPIETEFGGVPFAGVDPTNNVLISKFLQGLRQKAPEAIQKTAFIGVCVRSRDDSADNNFSVDGLLAKAGLIGTQLPNLGINNNTGTGINQRASFVSPQAPLIVNSLNALTGALGYAGAIGTQLNKAQQQSLAKLISNLSQSQTKSLLSMSSGTATKQLIDCAGVKTGEVLVQNNVVDPRLDASVGASMSTLWGVNANTAVNNRSMIFSSSVYNVLNGQAGAASLELGGYDYHDNTRTTGDARDLDAGLNAGMILQSAYLMNKPLFLYIVSDGAVSSANSATRNSPWVSDRGTAGMSYILYFNPQGRQATKSYQLGWFTSGQVADDRFITGGSAELAAAAVFANYLQLNGKLGQFTNIVQSASLSTTAQLDSVVKFA